MTLVGLDDFLFTNEKSRSFSPKNRNFETAIYRDNFSFNRRFLLTFKRSRYR